MHIMQCLQEKYLQAKSALIEMLKEIALTTDIWTSVATQVYITVTAHFIISKWKLKTCLLQSGFPKIHTANNIGGKLKEILLYF